MDRILTTNEVAEKIGVCRMTLYRWVKKGSFPKPFKIGGRNEPKYKLNRWKAEVVQDWINNQSLE